MSPLSARCADSAAERYDLLFDLEFFTRFSAIFSRLARARRSHGFSSKSQWRGRLHDVQVPFDAYHHVALNFLTLLRDDPMDPIDTAPIDGDAALPPLRAPAAAWEACCERLAGDPAWRASAPIVVINPNAGDMALERRWPTERVAELLGALAARSELNLVAIGSPAEREYVESVIRAARLEARVVNSAGRIDIAQLVALFSHAAVVVSNDSGPLHLAAAAGASTAALFGPETPVLYGPLRSRPGQRHSVHYLALACSPCMFVHDNKVLSCWFAQARCMTGIRPGDVLASIESSLAEATGIRAAEGFPARDRFVSGAPLRCIVCGDAPVPIFARSGLPWCVRPAVASSGRARFRARRACASSTPVTTSRAGAGATTPPTRACAS